MESHPVLVLPGNATEASVELQVFSGCEVVKKGIELWAVADTLLHMQQVLQDTLDKAVMDTDREN